MVIILKKKKKKKGGLNKVPFSCCYSFELILILSYTLKSVVLSVQTTRIFEDSRSPYLDSPCGREKAFGLKNYYYKIRYSSDTYRNQSNLVKSVN